MCVACPAGTFGLDGACSLCPVGSFSNSGSPSCAPVGNFAGTPFTVSVSALSQCVVNSGSAGYRTGLSSQRSAFRFCDNDLHSYSGFPLGGLNSYCSLGVGFMHPNNGRDCLSPSYGACMPSFLYTIPDDVYGGTVIEFVTPYAGGDYSCSCGDGVTYRLRVIASGVMMQLAEVERCWSSGLRYVVPGMLAKNSQV